MGDELECLRDSVHQQNKLRILIIDRMWDEVIRASCAKEGKERGSIVFAFPALSLSSVKTIPLWDWTQPTSLQYWGAANPTPLNPWVQDQVCDPEALELFQGDFWIRNPGRESFLHSRQKMRHGPWPWFQAWGDSQFEKTTWSEERSQKGDKDICKYIACGTWGSCPGCPWSKASPSSTALRFGSRFHSGLISPLPKLVRVEFLSFPVSHNSAGHPALTEWRDVPRR